MLTIFYDGTCPLCAKEMDALRAFDADKQILFVDVHDAHFRTNYSQIDFNEAMRVLHAIHNGNILKGLDATAAAWRTVGKKPWVQSLRWPVVRWFADITYVLFARNRYRLSWLLTGQSQCQVGKSCDINQVNK